MRISKEFLRGMIILEGPRSRIKIVVSNHNLKGYRFNKPIDYHQYQTEKIHQHPLCFSKNVVVNIGNSLYWYVDISVDAKSGRDIDVGVDNYIGSEVRIGDGKVLE